jgi:hypothetical protein
MARISSSRNGKRFSVGFLPLFLKASTILIPLSISRCPFRITSRFQPSSRWAVRWPPLPSSSTVFAINLRRSWPFSVLAVSLSNPFRLSVNSKISPPRYAPMTLILYLRAGMLFVWKSLIWVKAIAAFSFSLHFQQQQRRLNSSLNRLARFILLTIDRLILGIKR